MQNKNNVSRRQFLQSAGALSGATYLRLTGAGLVAITHAACSAEQQSAAFRILGEAEAADFAALAARIIPTTDTPGANEAGVIHFFDNAFAGDMADSLEEARVGLAAFNSAIESSGKSIARFSELSDEEQDAFLHTQDGGEFFGLVREMTIFGFFAMSTYGGNKDHVGWDVIGFEGHHGAWTYPFGHYDAEYAKENAHGE